MNLENINIEGYNIEVDNLHKKGMARTGVYIKKNINYKREKCYAGENESVITLKVGYPNKKKFYLVAYYRQWNLLFRNNSSNENKRFDLQTKIWEKMIAENIGTEIMLSGDFNIDSKIWNKKNEELSDYEKRFISMNKMIKERLSDNGMKMMIKQNTRNDKILDHFYTNKMEKIEEIKVDNDSTSDHNKIIIKRNMKIDNIEEAIIMSRKYKNINYDTINENIINDNDYQSILNEEDPETISNYLINIINNEMDKQEKIKKIKIKEKNNNKYSQSTLDLIKKKNDLYKENETIKTN